jgi:DNA gyrase subunit B
MPARNVHNEAIYAVRGKVKNLLKDDLDKCLENEEVSDIISILGCGIQNKYNSKKLNYGRVAIAVDGDADGFSIMTLISTLFYVLMPDFIKEERLCWLRAPIYKLQKGKNKYFVYSDLELPQAKNSHKNWEQTRIKGLGELNSEDMKESMLHPENRQLEILTIEDFNELSYWFELLMGKEVEPRTKFLFNNADFSEVLLYD